MTDCRIASFVALLGSLCVYSSLVGQDIEFRYDPAVRAVLKAKCGKCHGEQTQKADLNLVTLEGLARGGESGEPAIGDSLEDSPLWRLIADEEMPPSGQPQLTSGEKELIQNWIATGSAAAQIEHHDNAQATNQHDVLPIVLLRCVTCHGSRLKEGGLDLRTPESMLQGGNAGPALIRGDPDASLMIQRIESEACPPRDKLLKFFVRRPSSGEVETLRSWISEGAPEVEIAPDVATTSDDPMVSDTDRNHWAFQSPSRPDQNASIDRLVSQKLDQVGLSFSPEADRDTLIRRAFIDLIGMPPSVDQWKRWRSSTEDDWYSKMIDWLLASPRYGERWGRYWLDVAGYADSEGGVSADPIRKVAWKYRDYVIASFNRDTPYDRFLREQIAGDELVDYANASEITKQMVDNLVATGFLRMGIDQTGSRTMNFVPERLGVISDAIGIIGSGVMGLTMECVQCHSHKYDPIPHRDYYRFKAIFQGALDEHDWLTFKNRTLNVATTSHRQRVAATNPPLQKERRRLETLQKQAVVDLQLETLRQHYPEQSDADRQATIEALKVADNTRSQTQRILVEKLRVAELVAEDRQPAAVIAARDRVANLEQQIKEVDRQFVPPVEIRALWDRGDPSPTYILKRGEHDKPGRLVGPGVPSVLTDGKTPFVVESPFPGKTGRRLALANWLTDPRHPLTARVMVNRIWFHHFGRGIVGTLENFGVQGERPTHPELLDALAVEFTRRNWSIKEMHRLIMNSRTYRQSSIVTPERFERDPQNRFLSRMAMRRMDAEALRDSLLSVAGKLDETSGGPPDPISVDPKGLVSVDPTPAGGWRRSVYLQYRRTQIPTMMDTFDYPNMGPNCIARNVSTVSPQSLLMMNNAHVHQLAVSMAKRILDSISNASPIELVDQVYQLALSREPSEQERQLGIAAIAELESHWSNDSTERALATYCHTILNSAAFLYVD